MKRIRRALAIIAVAVMAGLGIGVAEPSPAPAGATVTNAWAVLCTGANFGAWKLRISENTANRHVAIYYGGTETGWANSTGTIYWIRNGSLSSFWWQEFTRTTSGGHPHETWLSSGSFSGGSATENC